LSRIPVVALFLAVVVGVSGRLSDQQAVSIRITDQTGAVIVGRFLLLNIYLHRVVAEISIRPASCSAVRIAARIGHPTLLDMDFLIFLEI
jgi:hypothetical protein